MSIPLETFLCPKNMRSLKSTSKALGILFYTYSNLNLPLILSTNEEKRNAAPDKPGRLYFPIIMPALVFISKTLF